MDLEILTETELTSIRDIISLNVNWDKFAELWRADRSVRNENVIKIIVDGMHRYDVLTVGEGYMIELDGTPRDLIEYAGPGLRTKFVNETDALRFACAYGLNKQGFSVIKVS